MGFWPASGSLPAAGVEEVRLGASSPAVGKHVSVEAFPALFEQP